jgi:hypothetical protein
MFTFYAEKFHITPRVCIWHLFDDYLRVNARIFFKPNIDRLYCIRIAVSYLNSWRRPIGNLTVNNISCAGSATHRLVKLHFRPYQPQISPTTIQIKYSYFLSIHYMPILVFYPHNNKRRISCLTNICSNL